MCSCIILYVEMAAVLFSKTLCSIYEDAEWHVTQGTEFDSFRCKNCVILCMYIYMLEISYLSCSKDCCCDI